MSKHCLVGHRDTLSTRPLSRQPAPRSEDQINPRVTRPCPLLLGSILWVPRRRMLWRLQRGFYVRKSRPTLAYAAITKECEIDASLLQTAAVLPIHTCIRGLEPKSNFAGLDIDRKPVVRGRCRAAVVFTDRHSGEYHGA